jgi:hypothetical protein
MKGPGIRIDLDVRRLWKCPQCGREMKATGVVTSRLCPASGCQGVWMKLVEPLRKPILRYSPPPQPALPEESDEPGPGEAADGPRASRKQRREQAAAGENVPVESVTVESVAVEAPVGDPLPREAPVEVLGASAAAEAVVSNSASTASVEALPGGENSGSEMTVVSDVGPAVDGVGESETNPS